MPIPNPIWGFHVAPGAVTGVRLRRDAPDTWTLEEEVTLRPGGAGAGGAVEACVEHLQRHGLDARPLFLALPDHTGSISIAVLTPDDLGLDAGELKLSLYSHTPFTPQEADLWHRPIEDGGVGRTHLVTAVPRVDSRPAHAAIAVLDPAYHGLGTSGLTLLRGARTLRLFGSQQVLLELLPEGTLLHAVYGRHVRRYLLRPGLNELVNASGADGDALGRAIDAGKTLPGPVAAALTEAAGPLAADVARVVVFHHEHLLRRLPPDADKPEPPRVQLVGPLAASAAVGQPLRRALGERAESTPPPSGDFVVRSASGGHLSPEAAARLVGAIGAALQGFGVPDEGLALRPMPQDVPEPPRRKPPLAALAGTVAVVAALAIAAPSLLSQDPDADPANGDPSVETGATDSTADPAVDYEAVHGIVRARLGFVGALREVRRLLDAGGGDLALERLALRHDGEDGGHAVEVVCVTAAGALPTPSVRRKIEEALDTSAAVSGVETEQVGHGLRVAFDLAAVSLPAETSGEIRSRGVLEQWLGMDAAWTAGDVEGGAALLAALEKIGGTPGAQTVDGRPGHVLEVPIAKAARVLVALAHGRAPYGIRALSVKALGTGDVSFAFDVDGGTAPEGVAVPEEIPVRLADSVTAAIASPLPDTPFVAASAGKPVPAGLRLGAVGGGPGQVTLSWPKGSGDRVIERSGASGAWVRVTAVGPDPGGTLDHVPGPGGLYRWRLGVPDASGGQWGALREVEVEVPVSVEVLGVGEVPGTARLALTRAWKGGKTSEEVVVGGGTVVRVERDRGDAEPLVFDTFATVRDVREETREESTSVQVPLFDPEGRVQRDESGAARLVERVLDLPVRYLVVRAGVADGPPLRWARKMTSP